MIKIIELLRTWKHPIIKINKSYTTGYQSFQERREIQIFKKDDLGADQLLKGIHLH